MPRNISKYYENNFSIKKENSVSRTNARTNLNFVKNSQLRILKRNPLYLRFESVSTALSQSLDICPVLPQR